MLETVEPFYLRSNKLIKYYLTAYHPCYRLVFEGYDRTGKDTMATIIIKMLQECYPEFSKIWRHGLPDRNTELGHYIDDILQNRVSRPPREAMAAIFAADKFAAMEMLNTKHHEGINFAVFIRSSISNYVYQLAGFEDSPRGGHIERLIDSLETATLEQMLKNNLTADYDPAISYLNKDNMCNTLVILLCASPDVMQYNRPTPAIVESYEGQFNDKVEQMNQLYREYAEIITHQLGQDLFVLEDSGYSIEEAANLVFERICVWLENRTIKITQLL